MLLSCNVPVPGEIHQVKSYVLRSMLRQYQGFASYISLLTRVCGIVMVNDALGDVLSYVLLGNRSLGL